jgi:hypothetical protein
MAIKAAGPPMAINGHCLGRRPLLSLSPIRVVPEPLRALFPQPWTPCSSHPRASTIADQAAAPAAAIVLAPLVPNSPSFLSLALIGPPGRCPRPRRHAAEATTLSLVGTRDPVRPSSSHVIYTAPLLDSCITNKGEESTQFMFPGGALLRGTIIMHLFRGSLHSCIWELLFA